VKRAFRRQLKKKKKNIDWTFDEIKELFLILEWGDLCF
jgi:hypothetical protein